MPAHGPDEEKQVMVLWHDDSGLILMHQFPAVKDAEEAVNDQLWLPGTIRMV